MLSFVALVSLQRLSEKLQRAVLRQHELELEVEDAQEELDITREERDAVLVSSATQTAAESVARTRRSHSLPSLRLCTGSV
jgi:phosphopantetheine adenylyltransferase